jgi:hypothetical protein
MTRLHRQIHDQEDKSWMQRHKNPPNMEFEESFQRVSGSTTTHVISSMPNTLHCSLICVIVILLLIHVYSKRHKDLGLWIVSNCEAQVPDFQWNTISFKHDAMKQTLQLSHSISTWPTSKFTIMLHFANAILRKWSKYQCLVMHHDSHDNILPAKLFPHWAQTVC